MGTDDTATVLRRKAQSGRDVHQACAMSVGKALRLTVAKVSDQMLDMAMSVIGAAREVVAGGKIGALFEEPVLLALLDGPERRTGAAILDTSLVGALIQQQTMGTVLPVPEGAEPRRMTMTDASLCAPFLDAVLERAALLPQNEDDRALLSGFRFGARAEDTRILQLALEAEEYEVIRLTLDIAGGKRQGSLTLVLPVPEAPVADVSGDGATAKTDPAERSTLGPMVMDVQAEIIVSLARLRLTLSEVGGFRVGDTLELGVSGLDNAQVLSVDGRVLSRGRLGLDGDVRAVQLVAEPPRGPQALRRADTPSALDIARFEAQGMDDAIDMPDFPDLRDPGADGAGRSSEPAKIPDQPERAGPPEPEAMPDFSDLPELSGVPALNGDTR